MKKHRQVKKEKQNKQKMCDMGLADGAATLAANGKTKKKNWGKWLEIEKSPKALNANLST